MTTAAQQNLINRARANGGTLNLAAIAPAGHLSILLSVARSIPGEIAYVQSNVLVLIGE